jgi:hypothetical protein
MCEWLSVYSDDNCNQPIANGKKLRNEFIEQDVQRFDEGGDIPRTEKLPTLTLDVIDNIRTFRC